MEVPEEDSNKDYFEPQITIKQEWDAMFEEESKENYLESEITIKEEWEESATSKETIHFPSENKPKVW